MITGLIMIHLPNMTSAIETTADRLRRREVACNSVTYKMMMTIFLHINPKKLRINNSTICSIAMATIVFECQITKILDLYITYLYTWNTTIQKQSHLVSSSRFQIIRFWLFVHEITIQALLGHFLEHIIYIFGEEGLAISLQF